jgi:hypothetical protein
MVVFIRRWPEEKGNVLAKGDARFAVDASKQSRHAAAPAPATATALGNAEMSTHSDSSCS